MLKLDCLFFPCFFFQHLCASVSSNLQFWNSCWLGGGIMIPPMCQYRSYLYNTLYVYIYIYIYIYIICVYTYIYHMCIYIYNIVYHCTLISVAHLPAVFGLTTVSHGGCHPVEHLVVGSSSPDRRKGIWTRSGPNSWNHRDQTWPNPNATLWSGTTLTLEKLCKGNYKDLVHQTLLILDTK